jgi:hypothetical protein
MVQIMEPTHTARIVALRDQPVKSTIMRRIEVLFAAYHAEIILPAQLRRIEMWRALLK